MKVNRDGAAYVVGHTLSCKKSGAATPAGAQQTGGAVKSEENNAALIAVEHHWTQAEIHGDVAYVDALLADSYRSVSADGTAHPKSAILASVKANGKSNKMALLVASYMKAHPFGTLATIQGDTGVVTFYSLKQGPKKGVMSSDVFDYAGRR
ncbi:MAG: nuclear transport factor 2 family protein [Candidatus Eremiobacteraeota bacterium]|nr:nuclear transport factor 2 family protein [Candidatus Eremiobacteraeota bacterium]MBC5827823.1 nuclear transport factor 2 family protein [Candidatus Eremiobacteraeota bacterium]